MGSEVARQATFFQPTLPIPNPIRERSGRLDNMQDGCEGGVDVVGVVTHLRGGAQVVLHGDQVVELSVLLGVHQEGEVEKDGEGHVVVEREEGEVKERRRWMTMRMV